MFISYHDQMCNDYFNLQPSTVKGPANISTEYEKRYLLQKLYSVYDFTIPESWSLAYFRALLFFYGSIAVIYTKSNGWICNGYSVTKMGLYYRPAVIECYNTFLDKSLIGVVGINSGIVHILDDRFGMDDILTRYAVHLAEIDKAISINLMITGTGFVYDAPDKKTADTVKELFARSTTGEPLVTYKANDINGDRKTLQLLNPDLKTNFIVNDLLIARRTLINNFLTEIGIASCNYDKKERLTTEEVLRNDNEINSLSSVILRNLKDDFAKINKISGLGLDVRLRGGDNNGTTNTMGDDAVG